MQCAVLIISELQRVAAAFFPKWFLIRISHLIRSWPALRRLRKKQISVKKIETAKKDNQQIFFKIGPEYYLINNGGWLKLASPEELISIDGKQTVKTSEINSFIKRKQITGMSPSESKEYSYEVYTR